MIRCFICSKKYKFICSTCSKDPFKVEKVRHILAEKNDISTLKNFYSKALPEIQDLNSASFWNKRLQKWEKIDNQDKMTKNRIAITAKYIPSNTKSILDIGIGHGFLQQKLQKEKKRKYDFYGLDISEHSIKNAKNAFKGEFKVGSVYNNPFNGKIFDVVIALEVLEHIPPHLILPILKNIHTLIKKKGVLIVSIPLNEGLQYMEKNPNGHVRMYTIPLILAELKMSGFQPISYEISFAFNKWYTLKNFLRKFLLKNRWEPNNVVVKAIVV